MLIPPSLRSNSYAGAIYVGALGSAALISAYGLAHVLLDVASSWRIALLDMSVAAVCLAAAVLARRGQLDTAGRQDAATAIVFGAITIGVLVESLLATDRQPQLTAQLLLTVAVSGVVIRSWAVHVGYLVAAIATWLVVHSVDETSMWLPTFAVAAGMSLLAHLFIGTVYGTTRDRELQAHALARLDALTGLPNRLGLRDQIRQVSGYAHRAGLPVWGAFLDVDKFKVVNDRWGHPAGDRVLVSVAEALLTVARGEDAVARWGGDEFVILGVGAPPEPADLEARIAAAIDPTANRSGCVRITVTCGVATVAGGVDIAAIHQMMHEADRDMYARRGSRA